MRIFALFAGRYRNHCQVRDKMNQNPTARKRAKFLPYALPSIGEEEIAEIADSMRSGWLTTGPKTKRFEGDLQAYIGARPVLADVVEDFIFTPQVVESAFTHI